MALVAILLGVATLVGAIAALLPAGFGTGIALAVLASSLLAQRSLAEHVLTVAGALETGGIAAGRLAVSRIVRRDPKALDAGGVDRAATESLAENFSDGIVAPMIWLAALGLGGAWPARRSTPPTV